MRILTWNCRRATAKHPLWDYLAELEPDMAMLQEVGAIPEPLHDSYEIKLASSRAKNGRSQRFSSALLVKGTIGQAVPLTSPHAWVREQLAYFGGNILAFDVTVGARHKMKAVAVYSPAWPVDRVAYADQDVSDVKLTQNPNVWVTDLVTAALRNSRSDDIGAWVVAGDFNSCETFDSWQGGPRGNREWLDRMARLGFTECLRHHQGRITPTYQGPGKTTPSCQIDHLFVSEQLALRLSRCVTGDAERVFGQTLSDHLPIIADFVEE